jgi:hypothetical protein
LLLFHGKPDEERELFPAKTPFLPWRMGNIGLGSKKIQFVSPFVLDFLGTIPPLKGTLI